MSKILLFVFIISQLLIFIVLPKDNGIFCRHCTLMVLLISFVIKVISELSGIKYNVLFPAYGNLGSVLSAQGRTVEAEIAFQRALKHRPNMADVHYNL